MKREKTFSQRQEKGQPTKVQNIKTELLLGETRKNNNNRGERKER